MTCGRDFGFGELADGFAELDLFGCEVEVHEKNSLATMDTEEHGEEVWFYLCHRVIVANLFNDFFVAGSQCRVRCWR